MDYWFQSHEFISTSSTFDAGSTQSQSRSSSQNTLLASCIWVLTGSQSTTPHRTAASICRCGDCNGLVHDWLCTDSRKVYSGARWSWSLRAVVLLLVLAWELCPFYDTNGAQLLETVTIHKQRLRTQDFLRSSGIGQSFGEVDGQAGLRMTLSICYYGLV